MFSIVWYLCTVASSALVGVLLVRQRHSMIRPSVQVACLYLVFIIWPACLSLQEVEAFLPDPYSYLIVLQGLVLVPLVVANMRKDMQCKRIWQRIAIGELAALDLDWRHVALLVTTVGMVLAWYLLEVPFKSTGLYAVFTNPVGAALAREESFKLLESAALRYAFAIFALTVAPVLLVLILAAIARVKNGPRPWKYPTLLLGAISVAFLTIAVSLSGARSFAVTLWLCAIAAMWFSRGLAALSMLRLLVAVGVLLVLPVTLTLAREGHLADLGSFAEYFWNFIEYRIVTGPGEVGTWYVHYAQTEGLFGIAAIPKAAALLGYQPIDAPNLIGRMYYGGTLASVNANAGFGFTYFSYFGMPGWLLSIAGVFALDSVLAVYLKLDGALLLACVSACSVAALGFTYADYTTVLLTNGFLVAPLLCWALRSLVAAKVPVAHMSPIS
ncbi:MAG: hypothetical protein CMLOHMNK_01661 [Steroidobacteraceae bacterium]|nr:hypothetical protein [Steroidobacteraceae bacterium]